MDIFRYLGVLVLDGDPLFCVLTEETLRLLGFRDIYTACRSAAGARIVEHHLPAIVLIDDDEDWEDVWTTLADPRHRSTVVVATSFDRGPRIRIDAIRRGADAFLAKPYSKAQLLRTLSYLLTGEAGRRCKIVPLRVYEQQASRGMAPAFSRSRSFDSGESVG